MISTALLPLFVSSMVSMQRVAWSPVESSAGALPPAPGGTEQTTSVVGDFDGDGVLDFVVTDRSTAPSALLYLSGEDGWTHHVIEDEELKIEAGGAAHDIDGDGDLDLVLGNDWSGRQLWWWENPRPDFSGESGWTRRIIKDDGGKMHHDQVFGDFDGDGRVDLATWVNMARQLRTYAIPMDPKAESPWSTFHKIPFVEGEGMAAGDVDGDGITDLLAGGHWFRWEGSDFRSEAIDPEYTSSRIAAADFIPGGRLEVVLSSGDAVGPLTFYTYSDGEWRKQTLIGSLDHGHTLETGDVDGDGHLDLFAAEMGNPGAGAEACAWMLWGDGTGQFEHELVSVGRGHHMSRLGDFDDDGDLDILAKPYSYGAPGFAVLTSNAPEPSIDRWKLRTIDADRPTRAMFLVTGDVNGDGWRDLAAGGSWYANPARPDGEWERHAFGGELQNVALLADFDADGDLDAFGTKGLGAARSGELVWAEGDGTGGFRAHANVEAAEGDFLQGVALCEIDGGLSIVLSWHEAGRGVQALRIPADPTRTRWELEQLAAFSEDECLSAGDLDGDGDPDLFQGTGYLRNDGGVFTRVDCFEAQHPPDRNRLCDVDGDGDLDAVVGYEGEDVPLSWLENPHVGERDSWIVHTVAASVGGGFSLDVGDLDGDGDPDVVLGEHKGAHRTLLFRNDRSGEAWNPVEIDAGDAGDHHDGTRLVDIDSDGDFDIVSMGWDHPRIVLFENHSTVLREDRRRSFFVLGIALSTALGALALGLLLRSKREDGSRDRKL